MNLAKNNRLIYTQNKVVCENLIYQFIHFE